jgi:hypothetical protein
MHKKLLAKYRAKRVFSKTAEPSGTAKVKGAKRLRSMRHRICIMISGSNSMASSSPGRSPKVVL